MIYYYETRYRIKFSFLLVLILVLYDLRTFKIHQPAATPSSSPLSLTATFIKGEIMSSDRDRPCVSASLTLKHVVLPRCIHQTASGTRPVCIDQSDLFIAYIHVADIE